MKVFICASKYNYKHIHKIDIELKRLGHKMTMPNYFNDPFIENRTKKECSIKHMELKKKLLKRQEKKVKLNDVVLVLNFEKKGIKNYLGGATFLEMFLAFQNNKNIYLYNPIPKGILEDEIIGMDPTIINGDLSKIK